jgi:Polyketide cyclase / dehydrase and lipid transport
MPEYGTSVVSIAPADKVWKIWSDTSTWGDWNPNVSIMELHGPFATGSTAIMHTKAGQHHKMRIVDLQPGRSFVLETNVIPGTTFRFNCRVEPVGAETKISQTVEVKGPLGFLGGMLGPGVSKDFGALLSGLAKKAET